MIKNKPKRSKYGNKKCYYQGLKFDSILELDRWKFLQKCEKEMLIEDLTRQAKYPMKINDKLICSYIADFEYSRNGKIITEDAKGVLIEVFRIKAKLFEAIYSRKIQIVKKADVTSLTIKEKAK